MDLSYLDEPSYFVFYLKKKKKERQKERGKKKSFFCTRSVGLWSSLCQRGSLVCYPDVRAGVKHLISCQPWHCHRSRTEAAASKMSLLFMQGQKEHRQNSFLKADKLQVFQPSPCFVSSGCSQSLNQYSCHEKCELAPLWDLRNGLYFIYSVWSYIIQCDIKLGICLSWSESHISCSIEKNLWKRKEKYRTDLFKLL